MEEKKGVGAPQTSAPAERDMINSPPHYKDRVPGIECIEVTKHFNFCRGNAIKYIWRAGMKGDEVEDLEKAIWYLRCEVAFLQKQKMVTEGGHCAICLERSIGTGARGYICPHREAPHVGG